MTTCTKTAVLPVSVDEAFALITQPERLRRWQTVTARIDLRAGGDFRWTVTPGNIAVGTVREVEPGKRIVLGWGWEGGMGGLEPDASTLTITLTPVGEGTRLDYTAHASVAGKLGQIGGRLIDASSRQLADNFFATFRTVLTEGNPTPASAPEAAASQTNEAPRPVLPAGAAASSPSLNHEIPRLVWFFAGVLATSVGVWMGAHWLA